MASLSSDLINANRLNSWKILVFLSLDHGPLRQAEHMIPGCNERLGDFFPTQVLHPTSQKLCIGFCQPVFACHPRHSLHPDAAVWVLGPAGCIDEKYLVTRKRPRTNPPCALPPQHDKAPPASMPVGLYGNSRTTSPCRHVTFPVRKRPYLGGALPSTTFMFQGSRASICSTVAAAPMWLST